MTLFPTVESRLTHILRECGYPNASQFTASIGEKNSQWRNWITRESFGRALVKISDATGASMDWLARGTGEPFPHGPIVYDGPGAAPRAVLERLASLERDMADVVAAFMVSLRAFSVTTPAAGQAVAADLKRALSRPGQPSAVLPALLAAATAAVEPVRPSVPAAPNKKRVRAK